MVLDLNSIPIIHRFPGAHPHSLALDSNGYSHISMYDSANGNLKYISDSSGSWVDVSLGFQMMSVNTTPLLLIQMM